jgi:hypothetical protein
MPVRSELEQALELVARRRAMLRFVLAAVGCGILILLASLAYTELL